MRVKSFPPWPCLLPSLISQPLPFLPCSSHNRYLLSLDYAVLFMPPCLVQVESFLLSPPGNSLLCFQGPALMVILASFPRCALNSCSPYHPTLQLPVRMGVSLDCIPSFLCSLCLAQLQQAGGRSLTFAEEVKDFQASIQRCSSRSAPQLGAGEAEETETFSLSLKKP